MKLKPLIPSLREKKRYIAYQVEAETQVSKEAAQQTIQSSVKQFVGDLGSAQAGIMFLKDWKSNTGIMRVNTKSVDQVKAALALIKEVNGNEVKISSVGMSGVVDKVRKSYF
tara:strand:- start:3629 stop:3964 length:336 start_codon:yes stop_codon:yes gene_type:complete